MIRKCTVLFLALLLFGFLAAPASATVIDLWDWGLNIDGALTLPGDPIPGNVDVSAFDFSTGLGTLEVTLTGAGAHYVDFFVDHEIDELINTFFNEYGSIGGTLAAGQSAEIDEPGYAFGDIFDNFLVSALDNTNGVPSGFADDVSMALGWDFSGDATVSFLVSETMPASGFYLSHTDPDSNDATIYFSSSVRGVQAPEPATMLLLGSGLLGLAAFGRKRLK